MKANDDRIENRSKLRRNVINIGHKLLSVAVVAQGVISVITLFARIEFWGGMKYASPINVWSIWIIILCFPLSIILFFKNKAPTPLPLLAQLSLFALLLSL